MAESDYVPRLARESLVIVSMDHVVDDKPLPDLFEEACLKESYSSTDCEGTIDGASITRKPASRLLVSLTIVQLCTISLLASFTNGIVTVGLPDIAKAVSLSETLYLWPSSVYGLASAATLLLAGSLADIMGARNVELVGITVVGFFTLACGQARSGVQLVIFRAFQGAAMSMHLTSSVSLVTSATEHGRARNLGFACLGLSQPLGFSVGLVLGGVMVESASWRLGFYLAGGAVLLVTAIGIRTLPQSTDSSLTALGNLYGQGKPSLRTCIVHKWMLIRTTTDWIGLLLASVSLALLVYGLATLSDDLQNIRSPGTAIPLAFSILLLCCFPFWMSNRARRGRAALIPNQLWRNPAFTSVCIMVALSNGVLNSMELFSSLYFQEIQKISPIFTSLRLMPELLVGVLINISVGLFVHKFSARWLVAMSSLLCAVAPLLMALVKPEWSYWYAEFWAQILTPASGDVLFTVGLLIISNEFTEDTQALAGAVFNTMAQLGWSLSLGLCQVVALGVSNESSSARHADSLLRGYRAAFWTMLPCTLACVLVALVGLRKTGRVGLTKTG